MLMSRKNHRPLLPIYAFPCSQRCCIDEINSTIDDSFVSISVSCIKKHSFNIKKDEEVISFEIFSHLFGFLFLFLI